MRNDDKQPGATAAADGLAAGARDTPVRLHESPDGSGGTGRQGARQHHAASEHSPIRAQ